MGNLGRRRTARPGLSDTIQGARRLRRCGRTAEGADFRYAAVNLRRNSVAGRPSIESAGEDERLSALRSTLRLAARSKDTQGVPLDYRRYARNQGASDGA